MILLQVVQGNLSTKRLLRLYTGRHQNVAKPVKTQVSKKFIRKIKSWTR